MCFQNKRHVSAFKAAAFYCVGLAPMCFRCFYGYNDAIKTAKTSAPPSRDHREPGVALLCVSCVNKLIYILLIFK